MEPHQGAGDGQEKEVPEGHLEAELLEGHGAKCPLLAALQSSRLKKCEGLENEVKLHGQ